ncbi:MAG TPA: ferrochelatase [Candidatus Binataceae bacterium]|jgi:ferrochelatase
MSTNARDDARSGADVRDDVAIGGEGEAASARCDSVMLIGFGGPTAPGEVRPFLDRVLQGRPVPRERYEEVVHHYELLGGRSPYNDLTLRQAAALRERLRRDGIDVPVVVGMRNTPPFIDDALRDLAARGARRTFGFILAAHRCEASWDRYQDDLDAARTRVGAAAPQFDYAPLWHNDPRFIGAIADRVRAAIDRLAAQDRDRADLIFTAHSIPLAMAGRAAYVDQIEESAAMVARAVGNANSRVAWQSRSGNPRDPWLEPDVKDVVRELGRAGGRVAVLVPIGFLCDHVEVLYDLDIEAAQIAREASVTMVRAATVSDHPQFIELMAALARDKLVPAPAPSRVIGPG